mmetsp:Transcript_23264/g.28539  ORF Transcript_23264/g.28539 Transcript_23264/m.28539 type:complete len:358 (+) Transcript_23264:113-1186(+)
MLSVILLILWVTDAGLTPLPKYIKISNSINWNDAATHCEGPLQSRLAFIGNANDNNEASSICGGHSCWFGLNDVTKEGTFKFAPNGETPGYTNWAPNEPNNLNNEDCVEILSNGQWNDLTCSHGRFYLCDNKVTTRGYIKGPKAVNYLEAYRYCRSQNSMLATITDDRDNADAARVCGNTNCWFGFNDLSKEGTFEWLDGSPVTYTKWSPGEPNNLNIEHCGHIWGTGGSSNVWNDLDCLDASIFPLCNPAGSTPSAKSGPSNVINDDEHELIKRLQNKINTLNDINNKAPINGIYFDNINVTNLLLFIIGITISFILIVLCVIALINKFKITHKYKIYSSLKQINTESEESATDVV